MTIKEIKTYLVIIFISIFFSLYLSEIYLTFYVKGGKHFWHDTTYKAKIYKKKTGKEYDTRSISDVYRELVAKNQNTVITFPPTSKYKKKFFSLSGVSNAKTIFCNESGYFSNYQSDRYGFNNPDSEWDSKEIEYLLVGDSYAHGACVNRPHDFASVLRKLSKKSVISLGYMGNGPLNEYASLREYIPKNVKNIIWMFYEENDLRDLSFEIKNKILLKYIEDKNFSQNLKSKQDKLDFYLKEKIENELIVSKNNEEYWKSYYTTKKVVLRFLRLDKTKNFFTSVNKKKYSFNNAKSLEEFKNILFLTKKLADENNSNLHFVYLGSYYRYKSNFFSNHSFLSNYSKIVKIVNDLDVPLIDTNEAFFAKEKNPIDYFPFARYSHYTVEGYNKLSSLIYRLTKKK
jgi:hypothetical protein